MGWGGGGPLDFSDSPSPGIWDLDWTLASALSIVPWSQSRPSVSPVPGVSIMVIPIQSDH